MPCRVSCSSRELHLPLMSGFHFPRIAVLLLNDVEMCACSQEGQWLEMTCIPQSYDRISMTLKEFLKQSTLFFVHLRAYICLHLYCVNLCAERTGCSIVKWMSGRILLDQYNRWKGKERTSEYLYSAYSLLKALRHGSHSFTCKLNHACLSFVRVHQMTLPVTEAAYIQ